MNDTKGTPDGTPIAGEIVSMRIMDLGGTLDLQKARKALAAYTDIPAISSQRHAPDYLRFATPIPLNVNSLNLDIRAGDNLPVTVTARLYPIGGLAVSLRLPVRKETLEDLLSYPTVPFRMQGKIVDRSDIAEAIFQHFSPLLHNAYEERFEEPVEPERYRAFCLTHVPGGAEQIFQSHRNAVAALLIGDPEPARLSVSQVEDVTRLWFSYYRDDFVVVDWDAAFVVEPAGKYEDLLYVFEVANLELMLLRKYDQYLDRVLNNGYDEYEKLLKGNPFFRHHARDVLAELSDVRMDLAEVTDELDNVAKFFGDYYLARIYMGLASKLHVTDYHKTVDEKLATLNDLYRSIVDYLESRQNLFLEWAIVWLIVFEIVMAFTGH